MPRKSADEQYLLERIKEIESGDNTELDLSGLNITRLPVQVYKLPNLKRIKITRYSSEKTINKNLLNDISKIITLEELVIWRGSLVALPSELLLMSSLKHLELNDLGIEHIPPEITKLGNLQHLQLYNNSLSEFPPEIGELKE
jgi:internalin A